VLTTVKCVSFVSLLSTVTLSCNVAARGHKMPFLQDSVNSPVGSGDLRYLISIGFWLRNYHQHLQNLPNVTDRTTHRQIENTAITKAFPHVTGQLKPLTQFSHTSHHSYRLIKFSVYLNKRKIVQVNQICPALGLASHLRMVNQKKVLPTSILYLTAATHIHYTFTSQIS
jgi:hypothetical protein